INGIEQLNGTNFTSWKEKIGVVLGVMDLDYALRMEKPAEITDQSSSKQKFAYEKWERSNRISFMIMRSSISLEIRGAIPMKDDKEREFTAKEFLASVEEQFKGSSKANASTLIMKMLITKYNGTSEVREHIMKMDDMVSKLKGIWKSLKDFSFIS
ncbi:UBN2_2 domain-containing protein, partial [Cephalotus follicularis]